MVVGGGVEAGFGDGVEDASGDVFDGGGDVAAVAENLPADDAAVSSGGDEAAGVAVAVGGLLGVAAGAGHATLLRRCCCRWDLMRMQMRHCLPAPSGR